MKIAELRDGLRSVYMEGTLVDIGEVREVTLRSGKQARVADSVLEDETGTVKLSLWNEQIDEVKVGDKVKVENGYTNTFRGDLQLNVGYYGKLTKV